MPFNGSVDIHPYLGRDEWARPSAASAGLGIDHDDHVCGHIRVWHPAPTPTDMVEDASNLSIMVCVQDPSGGSGEEDVYPTPCHIPVASPSGNPTRDPPIPLKHGMIWLTPPAVTGHDGVRAKHEPWFGGSVSKGVDMNSSGFGVHCRRNFSDTSPRRYEAVTLSSWPHSFHFFTDLWIFSFSNASWQLSAMCSSAGVCPAGLWPLPPGGTHSPQGTLPAATCLHLCGPHRRPSCYGTAPPLASPKRPWRVRDLLRDSVSHPPREGPGRTER